MLRSSYFVDHDNIYEASVMKGFEFTHHDVLNNKEDIESFERKIERIKKIAKSDLYIFYHHRYCPKTDEKKLLEDLNKLYARYKDRGNKVHVIMFTQEIVNEQENRKVIYQCKSGIHVFVFYTMNVWEGNNVWAQNDDDLIGKMMNFVREGKLDRSSEVSASLL